MECNPRLGLEEGRPAAVLGGVAERGGLAAGSIRKVGAAVQEAPSCNGWLFWHIEQRDGRLRVIDELREDVLRQT